MRFPVASLSSPARQQAVLGERAHAMRHHPSEAEAALWRLLSGGQLGVSFRRQLVLGGAIADFACPSARLVVEVDGATHGSASARRADARRDRKLAALGWRVLRVSAAELREAPLAVVARVREALRAPLPP